MTRSARLTALVSWLSLSQSTPPAQLAAATTSSSVRQDVVAVQQSTRISPRRRYFSRRDAPHAMEPVASYSPDVSRCAQTPPAHPQTSEAHASLAVLSCAGSLSLAAPAPPRTALRHSCAERRWEAINNKLYVPVLATGDARDHAWLPPSADTNQGRSAGFTRDGARVLNNGDLRADADAQSTIKCVAAPSLLPSLSRS